MQGKRESRDYVLKWIRILGSRPVYSRSVLGNTAASEYLENRQHSQCPEILDVSAIHLELEGQSRY